MTFIRLPRPKSARVRKDPTQSKRIDDAYCKALLKLIDTYQAAVLAKVKPAWPAVLGMREAEISPISSLWDQVRSIQSGITSPKDLQKVTEKFTEQGYLQGVEFASTGLDQMGISLQIGFGPADQMALDILESRNLTYLNGISSDLNTRLITALTDGLSKGSSVQDIMDDIQQLTDIARVRAERIARTEIMNAVNEGTKERYKMAGLTHGEWLTARDERVCTDCEQLDGKIYLLTDLPDGGPPKHPQCRCTILPVIEEKPKK